MRKTFINTLIECASKKDNLWLLCGDLGFSILEPFAERFPDRFINVGVAEQNMAGIAAGIASEGNTVLIYSIGNFPSLRCLEQIRNDICYHQLDVKIVSVGAGFSYGTAGYSHYAIEDAAVIRSLPNIEILTPADPKEVEALVPYLLSHSKPTYLRLGKGSKKPLYQAPPSIVKGCPIPLRQGSDLAIIATGDITELALQVALDLESANLQAAVYSMPFLKPLDLAAITNIATLTPNMVSIEEHREGGLFSALAEILIEGSIEAKLTPFYVRSPEFPFGGSQEYMRKAAGLDPEKITQKIIASLQPA